MKAAHLIYTLNAREKKELESILKQKGRKSLVKLYQTLRKTPRNQLKNEKVFEQTFDEPYSKKKDYLLRNELRLLTQETKRLLAREELLQSISISQAQESFWYLRGLRRRGEKELFTTEYDKAYKQAEEELNFHICAALRRMMVDQLQEDILQSQDFETLEQEINKLVTDSTTLANSLIATADYSRAYITRLQMVVPTNRPIPDPTKFRFTENLELARKDPYSNLLYYISQSYLHTGDERIKYLEEALNHLDACDQPEIDYARLSAACYNTLSISYMEKQQYKKATAYAKDAFERVFPNGYNPGILLANYLRCLTLDGKLDEGRKVFNQYGGHFKDIAYYPIILSSLAELEALLGDMDEALTLLTQMQTKGIINYSTYKLILICVYSRKEEYELALREVNNLLQQAKSTGNPGLDEDNKIRYAIREWLKIKLKPADKEAKLDKLRERNNDISEEHRLLYHRSPVTVWFFRQIDELLAKN